MSSKVLKKEGYTLEFEMTVSAEEFEQGMQKSYIKNRKNIQIDGFRRGKAPRKFIEKIYSEAVFYDDAVNIVFPDAYEKAIKELSFEPVDRPEVDIKQIGSGQDLILTVKVDTVPDVEVPDYKGIKATKTVYTVTDEQVEEEIKKLQDRNSRMITVEDRAVKEGDTAVIDFEGFVDGKAFEGGKGEDYDLQIGSGSFIPGFEEQLIGAATGDHVDVKVTFPEEYHAEELKGKDALFKVTVKQIKFKELPELDDEFAKDVSEFDTLEELKADIRKKFEEQNEKRSKQEVENQVIEKIVEGMKADIPNAMIESRIDSLMQNFEMNLYQQGMSLDMYKQYTGMSDDDFRKQFRPQAENAVKSTLAIEKIAKLEKIEATEEDYENQLADMAKNYNMEVDKLKDVLRDEDKENIKKDGAIVKTIQFLVEQAKVTEAKEKTAAAKKTTVKKAPAEKKETAKKTTAKKAPAAKKETAEKKTTTAKKTTTKKETAEKKDASEKKEPAKKTTAKKTATKKEEA